MSFDTYANLQTEIADTLNRDDLTGNIPSFISLAEAQIRADVRHWRGEATDTLTASGQYTALPSDFEAPVRLSVSGGNVLGLINAQQMAERRDAADDEAGEPLYYALTGGQMELFPTPAASETIDIVYRSRVPALSDSNTSNWVLEMAPDAYLYGALLHSAPFLVEDERIPVWASLYGAAVQRVNNDDKRGRWGGAGLVMRSRNG